MKALILAGGLATRMRPVTDRVPKSLLPALNVPFLEHQMDQLSLYGVNEVILLTGFLAEEFEPFVDRMGKRGIAVEVSIESEPLGTAGAARSVLDRIDSTVIVMNSDALVAGLDLRAAATQHERTGAVATLVLVELPDATGYGLVAHEGERALAFDQFGSAEQAGVGGWINAGNYILEREALAGIPEGVPWSFEKQVFPTLISDGAFVGVARSDGWWLDFGMPQRYLKAHADVLEGRAPTLRTGGRILQDTTLGDGTKIVGPSLLGHAKAGAGATIGPLTTIGDGVTIGAGAVVERSVVHPGASVGEGAVVRDSILGATAVVEAGATHEGALLA